MSPDYCVLVYFSHRIWFWRHLCTYYRNDGLATCHSGMISRLLKDIWTSSLVTLRCMNS